MQQKRLNWPNPFKKLLLSSIILRILTYRSYLISVSPLAFQNVCLKTFFCQKTPSKHQIGYMYTLQFLDVHMASKMCICTCAIYILLVHYQIDALNNILITLVNIPSSCHVFSNNITISKTAQSYLTLLYFFISILGISNNASV